MAYGQDIVFLLLVSLYLDMVSASESSSQPKEGIMRMLINFTLLLALLVSVPGVVFGEDPPQLQLQWGSYGRQTGQFDHPVAIAVDASGYVYVAEEEGRIQKFAPDSTYMLSWNGGTQSGTVQGLATDDGSNVYVTRQDPFNPLIGKFTSSGAPVTQWGSYGRQAGQFVAPMGIACKGNTIYILDGGDSTPTMKEYNTGGTLLRSWGTHGNAPGQMDYPRWIALDNAGSLLITDRAESWSVERFNDTTFVDAWMQVGSNGCRAGVAVDTKDDVYLTAPCSGTIQKFARDGTLLAEWGSDLGLGGFLPIAISKPDESIYVVDSFHSRILKFGYPSPARPMTWGAIKSLYR